MSSRTLVGKGKLHRGDRVIGEVAYTVQIQIPNGQATVVKVEPKPPAKDGELFHLTLEDGTVLNCRIIDDSCYCAVVGDGPITERRGKIRS